SVLVFEYTGRGFLPVLIPNVVPDSLSAIRLLGNEIAERRPEVQSWMPPPVSTVRPDSVLPTAMTYRSLGHFRLNTAYPVVEGYRDAAGTDAVAGGVRLNFSDRIGTTSLDFTGSYSPGQGVAASEQVHLRAVFRSWRWRVVATLNP